MGDRTALAVLLGRDARVCPRGVDQAEDREAVAVGDLHRAHRFSVALGEGHPELPFRPLLDVATLLLADEDDGAPVEAAEPGDHRTVVGAAAVAV
jgi:hypothetical protein